VNFEVIKTFFLQFAHLFATFPHQGEGELSLKPGLHTSGVECRFLFLLLSLIVADWLQSAPASISDNKRNKHCTQPTYKL